MDLLNVLIEALLIAKEVTLDERGELVIEFDDEPVRA